MKPVKAQSITYSDNIFNDSDWFSERIQGLNTTTFSTQQVLNGGNPNEYRFTRQDYTTNGNAIIRIANEFINNIYDPSLGSIKNINFSYDIAFSILLG